MTLYDYNKLGVETNTSTVSSIALKKASERRVKFYGLGRKGSMFRQLYERSVFDLSLSFTTSCATGLVN